MIKTMLHCRFKLLEHPWGRGGGGGAFENPGSVAFIGSGAVGTLGTYMVEKEERGSCCSKGGEGKCFFVD